jgi:futalosine hydrolase
LLPTANCQLPTINNRRRHGTATAFALGKHLALNNYDLAINFGIAGSFDRSIELGALVEISQDTFSELAPRMVKLFCLSNNWVLAKRPIILQKNFQNAYNLFNNFNLKNVSAITVNTVHGNEASIKKIAERLSPQTESMEGAAFFYACRQMNLPCLQIRAVSNYVEKRNRDNWK